MESARVAGQQKSSPTLLTAHDRRLTARLAPLDIVLPAVAALLLVALIGMVLQTQARLWQADTSDVIHHRSHAARAS